MTPASKRYRPHLKITGLGLWTVFWWDSKYGRLLNRTQVPFMTANSEATRRAQEWAASRNARVVANRTPSTWKLPRHVSGI